MNECARRIYISEMCRRDSSNIMDKDISYLDRGTVYHKLLQELYTGEKSEFDENQEEFLDEVLPVFEDYRQNYILDNDEFKVISSEKVYDVEYEVGDYKVILYFTPDLYGQYNSGEYFVMDHKTSQSTSNSYLRHQWRTRFQILSYAYLLSRLELPVNVGIANVIQLISPEKPKVLKNGKLSRAISASVTYATYLEAIEELGQDPRDYRDILTKLENKVDKRFERYRYYINENNLQATGDQLGLLVEQYVNLQKVSVDPPNPMKVLGANNMACLTCQYKDYCETALMHGHSQEVFDYATQTREEFRPQTP